jgi:hypothetical protein
MSLRRIGFLLNQPVSLNIISETIKKIPGSYVYFINPSF